MLFLMLAAVLFALLVGALAFVTGPVGLAMAAAIALWLLLYAARALLRVRTGGRPRGGSRRQPADDSAPESPAAVRPTPRRTTEAVHHV